MSGHPLSYPALLAVLLAIPACGGDVISGTTSYIVPGPPDTSYPIESAEIAREGSSLRIGYNMPLLLVGVSQRVSLRGELDAAGRYASVTGNAGTGTCDLQPGGGLQLRCNERLTGVTVDLVAVEQLATQTDPQTAANRVAVARKFLGEPIGILEVR